jgi:regulator of sigma E protease
MTLSSLLNILISALLGIFVLGVLVIVHELGHFLVAKWCGIRVLAFSVGFGKSIFTRTCGGTEYRISAIPFGGYVHMAGEHPEDGISGDPGEFTAKPIWQRALVAFAGPTANALFAIATLWLVFILGTERPLYLDNPVIGGTLDSSSARAAGFLPGDSILSINGKSVSSWDDIENFLIRQDREYSFQVRRDDSVVSKTLATRMPSGTQLPTPNNGLLPAPPSLVGSIVSSSPAQQAGLMPHDLIVSINGDSVASWYQVSQIISHYDTSKGPMRLLVRRADSVVTLSVMPRYSEKDQRFLAGIGPAKWPSRIVKSSPGKAVGQAIDKAREDAVMIFVVIKKLVIKEVSAEQLSGPVGIVQMSGAIALLGLSPILLFMALIGINLAVLNLLPLVITDGGLLLFLLIEAIRRKPLPLKSQLLINRIAITFFIALFLYVTFNDIKRIPMLYQVFGK